MKAKKEKIVDPLVLKLLELMKNKGVTAIHFEKNTDITIQTFWNWKTGNTKPRGIFRKTITKYMRGLGKRATIDIYRSMAKSAL